MIRCSCQFRVFENRRVSAEVESVAAGRDSGGNDNTSLRRQRSRRPNDVQDAADGQTEISVKCDQKGLEQTSARFL